MILTIEPIAAIDGELRPPSDKSLTHRAFMFGAIASSPSIVRKPLLGEDCESTLSCLQALGLKIERGVEGIRLFPTAEWTQPTEALDCGNSGTTLRLLSGLIASRPLDVVMFGDASLSKRPMGRIAAPLALLGATMQSATGQEGPLKPPVRLIGGSLTGIDYVSPVASAQIKSCALLAGLRASGTTRVKEPSLSRDHTERMLRAVGVDVRSGEWVEVDGGQVPTGFDFTVPADISSAAFFMVAAAIAPRGRVVLREVGVNPTRTGILDVFAQCGIPCIASPLKDELGEPVADIEVRSSLAYRPFEISGDLVPRLIDEIPVLAVLATQCEGTSVI
ncbi:MAG: 3-phosphoshikimate 1-carboxyvinyltransferase, partial [Fimbriimonas sp.]